MALKLLREIFTDAKYVVRNWSRFSDKVVKEKQNLKAKEMLRRLKSKAEEEEKTLLKIRENALNHLKHLEAEAEKRGVNVAKGRAQHQKPRD